MKTCSKCKENKDESEFSKNHRSRDGLQYQCKDCTSKYWKNKTSKKNEDKAVDWLVDQIKDKIQLPEIEKGVPIPPRGYGDAITTFLQKMEVEDSFVTPKGKVNTYQMAAKKVGIKLICRQTDPLNARVWRIA